MFHYDRGLKITALDLAIDVRRRQPRGFVSHAHADHMARHELAYCTPMTAAVYRHRLGGHRAIKLMPFGETLEWVEHRLTTMPAGHILGSAMLHVEGPTGSLLYTGDFKLRPSATAEVCQPRTADVLVMESTFGDPKYRLPPRDETARRLVSLVSDALAGGRTPVVHAYVLGKAQEATKLLTDAGVPVLQHRLAWEITQLYQAAGCDLGNVQEYPGHPLPGHAVIVPPRNQAGFRVPKLEKTTSIAVTGWAMDPTAAERLGVDHALPLSDHADFDELLELVRLVSPREIYCTHGPRSFVDVLKAQGYAASVLEDAS